MFVVSLSRHEEAATHLAAFKHAVTSFPAEWEEKEIPLKLKATAWLAGFPVTNTEIAIASEHHIDFIGPGIDLGFRLSKFADVRRFILSADLTLMLLDAIDRCELDDKSFRLHLHGREPLKGVNGNEPYPIVWLDNLDGCANLEEELLGIRRTHEPKKLKDFLRDFLDKTPRLMRPFIANDPDSKYGTIPPELEKIREKMIAEESDRGYLNEPSHTEPAAGADEIPLQDPKSPE